MIKSYKLVFVFLLLTLFLLIVFFAFTLFNNLFYIGTLPKPSIYTRTKIQKTSPKNTLKILSYNIHFGMGLDDRRIDKVDKKGLTQRLDRLAQALRSANADIVFLQEVDFYSTRTHKINQAAYLAEKSGYSYFSTASHWRKKIFPDINGKHGFLDHGLSILSKYPLAQPESYIFKIPEKYPLFLRWVFNPHGALRADVKVGKTVYHLINIHLDPWSSQERENQIKKILLWTRSMSHPIILGGDLNIEPKEVLFLSQFHLKDTPWFISIDEEKLKKEKTLPLLRKEGFKQCISPLQYRKNPKNFYSFSSNNPKVLIDHLFVSKDIQVLDSGIFHKAHHASDHLPIYAEIQYLRSEYSSQNTKAYKKIRIVN